MDRALLRKMNNERQPELALKYKTSGRRTRKKWSDTYRRNTNMPNPYSADDHTHTESETNYAWYFKHQYTRLYK